MGLFHRVRVLDDASYISILSTGYFAISSEALFLATDSSANCALKCPSTKSAYPPEGAMSARWALWRLQFLFNAERMGLHLVSVCWAAICCDVGDPVNCAPPLCQPA